MWNPAITTLMTELATSIEASFEPVNSKVREIDTWFEQMHAKINASDFQLSKNMEPIQTTMNKKNKRTKKPVEKEKDPLPEDISPFDSTLSDSGHCSNEGRSTRNSRAAKRTSKLSKSADEVKTSIIDETYCIPTRSSRAASKAAVNKISTQLNQSLTKKLRRPSEGTRVESMDFQPAVSSTINLGKNDKLSFSSPGPKVKQQIQAFEKMNILASPDASQDELSQDEDVDGEEALPKTPLPTRVTRSKAPKPRKSAGAASTTKILKKTPTLLLKKKVSIGKVKRRSGVEEKHKEARNGGPSSSGDAIKRKKEELLKKQQDTQDEARKKKEEQLKAQAEEAKRRREEKRAKAAAVREAAEKQKQEAALKLEKDKEERKRLQLEREEKLKEEQEKKRQIAIKKVAETEERRRQDEAARQARLREVAEEQKRAAALKLREQEEHTKRKQEEANKAKAKNPSKLKEPKKEVTEYKCTPSRDERPLKKPKTEEDYGLEDASASDSSEDESNPKKEIPQWARPSNRNPQLLNQIYYPGNIIEKFMSCKKEVDLSQIFKTTEIKFRSRTSSAVWTSPISTSFYHKK